jgi:hypothetical protein
MLIPKLHKEVKANNITALLESLAKDNSVFAHEFNKFKHPKSYYTWELEALHYKYLS